MNFLPFSKRCHQVVYLIIQNHDFYHFDDDEDDHVNIDDDYDVDEVDDDDDVEVHPLPSLLHWLQVKSVHHWKLKYFTEATIMFGGTTEPRLYRSMKAAIFLEKQQLLLGSNNFCEKQQVSESEGLLWSECKSKCSTNVIQTAAAQQTQSFTDAK